MKFLKKLNPFKRKPVGEPKTLKDFVQAERDAAPTFEDLIRARRELEAGLYEEDEQPETSSDEDEWRDACSDLVETILFNVEVAELDDDDNEKATLDFRSEDLATHFLINLLNLQKMIRNQGSVSDTDILLPEVVSDEDWDDD